MSEDEDPAEPPGWERTRRAVVRNAAGVGVAVGAYGLSFGALATTSGLSIAQACALSVLTFTGGSQFALVGVIGAGRLTRGRGRLGAAAGGPQRAVRAAPRAARCG